MVGLAKFNFGLAIATIASLGIPVAVYADTVTARCDVYPKGEDRATSSGLCTFSQRQGVIGIQLKNGKRYDLVPANQPNHYRDQNGRAAYQQSGLGDKGQIFRLVNESIYVYWDTAPYGQNPGSANSGMAATSSAPEVGTPVAPLSDLVGARAGQAESTIEQRGYQFLRTEPSGDAIYSYWREAKTNYCVIIRTANGRYDSIVYGSSSCK
uniref:Uncharacterized protein n=1 Tax=Cyanothece sp. (strain PCC 7425 / ATCC 29141) TaxID=395961 RepID=B8HZH8_CYAP4